MSITNQTRRESLKSVKPNAERHRHLIVEILEREPMTAMEVAEVLFAEGHTPYLDRNFAAPRLTELKNAGKVINTGKKYCKRTDRNIALWSLVKEVD